MSLHINILFFDAFLLCSNFFELLVGAAGAWWVALIAIGLVATTFAAPVRNLMGYFSAERHRTLFSVLALFALAGLNTSM
ncbi:MAG: hypothetical protein ABGW81_07455 [Paracoccaceae bacterium]